MFKISVVTIYNVCYVHLYNLAILNYKTEDNETKNRNVLNQLCLLRYHFNSDCGIDLHLPK